MIGQQHALRVQPLDGREKSGELPRRFHVRRLRSKLTIRLSQRAAAEPISARPEIDEQETRVGCVLELGRERTARVRDGRESGDDERQRRRHFPVVPACAHGKAVLADRNGNAERGTQLHAHRLNCFEERLLLGVRARCGHPVGRQHHPAEIVDRRRAEVRQRFAHRHPRGCRWIDQRDR